jgi:hypothetical protein
MAIDYIINYSCPPKDQLSSEGILSRLKGEERAHTIIRLFRENDDQRPPSEMGFEFTRRTPQGDEENRVIVVQDLLDNAEELRPLEKHCEGCPANRAERRFGCMNFVRYPISATAESWLLDQLPVPDEILVWQLLKMGVSEFKYDGSSIEPLRNSANVFFEADEPATRLLGAFEIDANQLFEMIFSVGNVSPNHAAMLLMFVHAITRNVEADEIKAITSIPNSAAQHHPFILATNDEDDPSVAEYKAFFHALHTAWTLNVQLILDV